MAAAHAQLVELLRNAETLHALFNQKGRHTARAQLGLALGVHHQGVGIRAVGDPHLGAVEQVITALVFGLELHAQHVRARTGLGHGQGTDVLTTDELGQVFGALLGRAVALDLVDTQVGVRAVAQAHRGAGTGDFFHGDHVRQVAHVRAAVFLTHGDAQHAQVAHLAPQVHGELVVAVDFGRAGGDFGLGKVAHRVAQSVDVFTELEVQAGQVVHGFSVERC